jgi:hypothetical protein
MDPTIWLARWRRHLAKQRANALMIDISNRLAATFEK